MVQKIVPNLWFHGNAVEAGQFYAEVFPKTTTQVESHYPEHGLLEFQKPLAGEPLTVTVDLAGTLLRLINAGPEIRPNPSISFSLQYHPKFLEGHSAREALESAWGRLAEGGNVLMQLQEYPFSPLYGWVEDRYGVSWQLSLGADEEPRNFVVPCLMFGGDAQNRAEEAVSYYQQVFDGSSWGQKVYYPKDAPPVKTSSLMYSDFLLEGQQFSAMDSGVAQDFSFGPGVSLEVNCKGQAEIDRLWLALSAHPSEEQCGWARDRFGVSWQIVPENIAELLQRPNAFEKLMSMGKIVIEDF